jgi:transcriptional antiterminator NusG
MVADDQVKGDAGQESAPIVVPVQPATDAPTDAGGPVIGASLDAGQVPAQESAPAAAEPVAIPISEMPVDDAPAAEETPSPESARGPAVSESKPSPDKAGVPSEPAPAVELVADEELDKKWYILKVQVNREDSIRDAIFRRIKVAGIERYFGDIVVPTEDVAEFNKSGKRRIVRRKLYPGYILVNMAIDDESWFLVRETPGVGDFTGSAGKPTALPQSEVDRILKLGQPHEEGGAQIKTAIPFKSGDRVRVKDGNFQNYEGDVDSIDEANGSITVMINIFNRSVPVELKHWQVETI